MALAPAAQRRSTAARAGRVAAAVLAVAVNAAAAQGAPTIPRWQVEASVVHDDNVTRGRTDGEIASDESVGVRVSRDWDHALTRNARVVLTAAAGGDAFRRHERLSRAFAEAEAAVEYRPSGAFGAPTVSAFVRAAGERTRSVLRSGTRVTVGARVAAALTDRVFAVVGVSHDESDARSEVFAGRRTAIRLVADYALSDRSTVYATVEARQGDTTASGRESLENVDIAKVFVADDAFADRGLQTYRFDARTVVATVGVNVGIASATSIDLSWRRAETRPRVDLPFVSTLPNRYVADQFVIALVKRF